MRQVRFTVDPMRYGPLGGSVTTVTTGSANTFCQLISAKLPHYTYYVMRGHTCSRSLESGVAKASCKYMI